MSYSYSLKKSKQRLLTRNSINNLNSNKSGNSGSNNKLNDKYSFRAFEKKQKNLQLKQLEEVEEVEEKDDDDENIDQEEEEEEEEINNNILSKYGYFYDENVLNEKNLIKSSINQNEKQLKLPNENNTNNNSDINRILQAYSYQEQNEETADQEDLSNLLSSLSYITNESGLDF